MQSFPKFTNVDEISAVKMEGINCRINEETLKKKTKNWEFFLKTNGGKKISD